MTEQSVDLAVTLEGPPDAPVLVLLHSIGTSSEIWAPLVPALSEHLQVLRIDLRGHGRSPAAGAPSIDVLARDVLAVLDRQGIARAHVAGVSLGGMVALWLAARHPDRVDRLVVVCSSARPGNAPAWLARAGAVRADGLGSIADAVVARWLTAAFAERRPEVVAQLRALLEATDAETYAQCCEVLADLDLLPDVPNIIAPTLVLGGTDDLALPTASHGAVVAALVPGARAAHLPAAHIPTVEVPDLVAERILGHLRAFGRRGDQVRREVLGDAHVDRAVAATTEFTADFQDFLTRYAWGEVWDRPGLGRRERSIATLGALVALGAEHEIGMHVRAAVRNGLRPSEIAEVLLHVALYAGLPRANRAFAIAQEILSHEPEES